MVSLTETHPVRGNEGEWQDSGQMLEGRERKREDGKYIYAIEIYPTTGVNALRVGKWEVGVWGAKIAADCHAPCIAIRADPAGSWLQQLK